MPMIRSIKLWRGSDWELFAPFSVKSSSDKPSMEFKDMLISRKTRLHFSRECLCHAARNGGRSSQSTSTITSIKKRKKSCQASPRNTKRSTISLLSNASCKACLSYSATSRNAASSNGSLTKTNRTWVGGIQDSPLKSGNLIWLVSMRPMMQASTAVYSDDKRQNNNMNHIKCETYLNYFS